MVADSARFVPKLVGAAISDTYIVPRSHAIQVVLWPLATLTSQVVVARAIVDGI